MKYVDLNNINNEILKKIPYSLRLNAKDKKINYDELPTEIQFLLNEQFEKVEDFRDYSKLDVLDIRPTMSTYNDFEIISSVKGLVSEYFQNYIATTIGTYPFDPNAGNQLAYYLFQKDNVVTETFLGIEFQYIAELISNMFGLPIKIKNNTVIKTAENVNGISYYFDLTIIIDNTEPFTSSFSLDTMLN